MVENNNVLKALNNELIALQARLAKAELALNTDNSINYAEKKAYFIELLREADILYDRIESHMDFLKRSAFQFKFRKHRARIKAEIAEWAKALNTTK